MFKLLFFIGCGICFFSLFLNFYSFRVISQPGVLISIWEYNFIFGWEGFNTLYLPPNLGLSIEFMIFYLCCIITAMVLNILKNIEKTKNLSKFMLYAYINISLLMLIGFMVLIFPCFYLLQNGLFFPTVIVIEDASGYMLYYAIGIGYYLHIISFIMIFPYVIFYYQSIRKFNIDQNSFSDRVKEVLAQENEGLDIDKYITEEEIRKMEQETQKQKEFNFKSQVLREGGL
ncbi:MAG: hypothetical protein R6W84_02500 [Promethearchaeia archaeon]